MSKVYGYLSHFFSADVTMCKKSNFVFDKIWKKHLQKSDSTLAKYEKNQYYPDYCKTEWKRAYLEQGPLKC